MAIILGAMNKKSTGKEAYYRGIVYFAYAFSKLSIDEINSYLLSV